MLESQIKILALIIARSAGFVADCPSADAVRIKVLNQMLHKNVDGLGMGVRQESYQTEGDKWNKIKDGPTFVARQPSVLRIP